MSLKAGRVGVNPADVDPIDGHINPESVDSYTKTQADAKFSTKDELRIAINDIDLLMGSKLTNVYGVMGKNGAKNLLKWETSTPAETGVTATINADGTVTLNGTSTAKGSVIGAATFELPAGTYKLSGCKGGASDNSTYLLDIYETQWTNRNICTNDTVTFTFTTNGTHYIRIWIEEIGLSFDNLVIKPMITLVEDAESDYEHYQPYAMINRELTEKKLNKTSIELSGIDLNDVTETGFYYIRDNCTNSPSNVAYVSMRVQKNSNTNIQQTILGGSTIYTRTKGNSWGSWYSFTGTEVV